MKMTYDQQADVAYIRLADGPVTESEEVAPGIVLDFDAESRVLGIEALPASKTLAPGAVTSLVAAEELSNLDFDAKIALVKRKMEEHRAMYEHLLTGKPIPPEFFEGRLSHLNEDSESRERDPESGAALHGGGGNPTSGATGRRAKPKDVSVP